MRFFCISCQSDNFDHCRNTVMKRSCQGHDCPPIDKSTSFEQRRIASDQNASLTPLKRPLPGNYDWKTLLTHIVNCLSIVGWATNILKDMHPLKKMYRYPYMYTLYYRMAKGQLLRCGFHLMLRKRGGTGVSHTLWTVSSGLYNITQNCIGWDMEIMQSKVV